MYRFQRMKAALFIFTGFVIITLAVLFTPDFIIKYFPANQGFPFLEGIKTLALNKFAFSIIKIIIIIIGTAFLIASYWKKKSQGNDEIITPRSFPKIKIFVFFSLLLFGGLLSICLRQDNSYDLRNYHLYTAWAFLNGHLFKDVLAASVQTYFNPLLDLPYYFFAVKWLPNYPVVVAFLAGLPFGALIFFTWLIARKIAIKMNFGSSVETECVAIVTTVFGLTGSASISQLGTTYNEVQVAVFNIAALYFLLRSTENNPKRNTQGFQLLAGALLGISTGMKLTALIFTLGAAVAILLVTRGWKLRLQAVLNFGLAWLLAFGLVYGWWGYKLWQSFGNPIFPFFNKIFASPWYPLVNFSDARFIPKTILQKIFYPFFWLTKKHMVVTEVDFSDYRFSFGYLGILILLGSILFRKIRQAIMKIKEGELTSENENNTMFYFLIIFVIISYICWEYEFSILRYAISIEVLTGIVLALAIKKSGLVELFKLPMNIYLSLAMIVLAITTNYPDWGRISYHPSTTFQIESPTLPDNSMVLLVSFPTSYIAPFITMVNHESPEFIGIYDYSYNMVVNYKLGELIRTRIHDHKGPIFLLAGINWKDWNSLKTKFGISVQSNACQTINTNRSGQLKLCPVY